MIIDSHAHVGLHEKSDMKMGQIIRSMEKFGITFTLLANAEAEEYNGALERYTNRMNQVDANQDMIDDIKKHPDKLGALIWIKPKHEVITKEFIDLIERERKYIYGIKVHPYHSMLPFNDELMVPYIELARKYDLPIVTHTANSPESDVKLVAEMAQRYTDVIFVAVHMGLWTDNKDAIKLVSEIDNLYGDTTWVKHDTVVEAVKTCGINKIMFGTDNPIAGENTIGGPFYQPFFSELKDALTKEEYEHLMYKNAQKVFKIK